jgi:hypothetical protein
MKRGPSDTARQRANATRKAILRYAAKRGVALMPYDIAKAIRNLPGPVARAMRALADRGLLKETAAGWTITSAGQSSVMGEKR